MLFLFGILQIPAFVNHKGNYVNSDWLVDQWDKRSISGQRQLHKGSMKDDDREIDTAKAPKHLDGRVAHLEKENPKDFH